MLQVEDLRVADRQMPGEHWFFLFCLPAQVMENLSFP